MVYYFNHVVEFNPIVATHVELCEVGSAQVKKFPVKGETGGKKKQCFRQRRAARDSGVAESVEDSDSLTQDRYCTATAHLHVQLTTTLTTATTNSVNLQAQESQRYTGTDVHRE